MGVHQRVREVVNQGVVRGVTVAVAVSHQWRESVRQDAEPARGLLGRQAGQRRFQHRRQGVLIGERGSALHPLQISPHHVPHRRPCLGRAFFRRRAAAHAGRQRGAVNQARLVGGRVLRHDGLPGWWGGVVGRGFGRGFRRRFDPGNRRGRGGVRRGDGRLRTRRRRFGGRRGGLDRRRCRRRAAFGRRGPRVALAGFLLDQSGFFFFRRFGAGEGFVLALALRADAPVAHRQGLAVDRDLPEFVRTAFAEFVAFHRFLHFCQIVRRWSSSGAADFRRARIFPVSRLIRPGFRRSVPSGQGAGRPAVRAPAPAPDPWGAPAASSTTAPGRAPACR